MELLSQCLLVCFISRFSVRSSSAYQRPETSFRLAGVTSILANRQDDMGKVIPYEQVLCMMLS